MNSVLTKATPLPLRLPIFPSPQKAGAGFKNEHLNDILNDDQKVGFFEVHAENYMGKGGAPHAALARLRQDFPLFVHGVGLSIGGDQDLSFEHLQRLKAVVDRYEPHIVSEHLAWSSHDTTYYNDLLPVPYTEAVLSRVISHIHQVQDVLGRRLVLENPSTYVAFDTSSMSETEFISAIAKHTGCGLLLDINNVFISATNHNYSPEKYLADFPLDHVQEIHLAGHATETDDDGKPLLIDAHDREVSTEVWDLYESIIALRGVLPTLIEWDNDVPAWNVLKAEATLADRILSRFATPAHPELYRRAG
jgi:uncharacterized protein (UPF0276 family)